MTRDQDDARERPLTSVTADVLVHDPREPEHPVGVGHVTIPVSIPHFLLYYATKKLENYDFDRILHEVGDSGREHGFEKLKSEMISDPKFMALHNGDERLAYIRTRWGNLEARGAGVQRHILGLVQGAIKTMKEDREKKK
jgi:hypothetical protein